MMLHARISHDDRQFPTGLTRDEAEALCRVVALDLPVVRGLASCAGCQNESPTLGSFEIFCLGSCQNEGLILGSFRCYAWVRPNERPTVMVL